MISRFNNRAQFRVTVMLRYSEASGCCSEPARSFGVPQDDTLRVTARRCSAAVLLLSLLSVTAAHAQSFKDPAPPQANNTAAPAAPSAQKNPDATFHVAPKALSESAVTEDWPCFLGPRHNEFSAETKLLQKFPAGGPTLIWEMKKGEGYAEPAVVGDRVILFHRVDNNEVVDCLNGSTGERFWRFSCPTAYQDRYGYCNGPRSSPAVADDRVFTFGAEGKLHCLDLNTGMLRWKRDILAEFKLRQNFFGVGCSPLVVGDRVILNVGANDGPCVAAFDTTTGKMLWGAGNQWGPSYASPVSATINGKNRVLVFAGGESRPPTGGLLSIDPENGRVDFSFPWRGTRRESVNASSPVAIGNQIFVSECYGSGGALIEVLPDFTTKTVWTNPQFGTHFMTAIPKDGYLYGIDGHGPADAFFCCVDLKNGNEVWRTQPRWTDKIKTRTGDREIPLGTDRCNLLMIDGRCLCLGEYGHLLWIDLNPKGYKELDRTWLVPAVETWTPPVVSRGLLYICQNTQGTEGQPMRVLCYDLRGE